MEDLRWNMFSGSGNGCQASVEDSNEFPGTDLLLDETFESEIVARRFQEGGLSFKTTISDRQYAGTHKFWYYLDCCFVFRYLLE